MLTRNQILTDGWRLWLYKYAEVISQGNWIAFDWVKYVCQEIQHEIIKGNARIIINAPPRHGKSELISRWLSTWYLDWFPERKIILASYGEFFATKWGVKVRDEFMTNKETWTKVHKNQAYANDWQTYYEGGMKSTGVDGSITGEGGDLNIIDDPHKNWEEAHSKTYLNKVIDWFNSTLYTRLEPNASIIVVQTRWSENDLTAYLINEHEDDWKVICLPALCEGDDDPLGRKEGEALCPERYDAERLQKIKRAMGSYMFAGLYQQRPGPPEGSLIKRDWFRRWTEIPSNPDEWLQGWDFTFTDTGSSYVVGQVWLRKGANYYLIDQSRDKLDFPGMQRKIQIVSERWPDAKSKIVERAASGWAIIATLEDKIPGLIGWTPKGSKESRLVAVSGLIEAGNVYIPDRSVASWVDDFEEEVVVFPNGKNDDQVDAMTMSLLRLSKRTSNYNFVLPDSGTRESPWKM